MTSPPLVSVLLPYRDASATLAEAVHSIRRQSLENFELLLIDDGSTDGSGEAARALAQEDRRIRLLETVPPGGLVSALNLGIDRARAPYLARMDADDAALPRRLELQWAFLEEHPALTGCGSAVRITGPAGGGFRRYEQWQNTLLDPEAIHRERFIESPLVHPTAFLRTGRIRALGGYRDMGWAEDYDLWLRILEEGPLLGKLPGILLHWRDSLERLTRSDGRYSLDRFQALRAGFIARLEATRRRGVAICGAGPTGKGLARHLLGRGVVIHAFHDVHPRRLGGRIQGIPVRAPEDFVTPRPVLLGAVGIPQEREAIRALAKQGGYVEGGDFFLVS